MTLIDYLDQLQAAVAAAPVPNPGSGEPPPELGEKVLRILRWVAYLAVTACVGGLLFTAAKMALSHRRGDDTNVSQLGWVFAACLLIGSASAIVSALI
ncbi:hypothetical protein Vqi01_34410 [Micromonospora qiuiae]|uniref:Conjugal transfer protein TrbC n=1 Tax=Micromonospora qiuiae TaxID=502268 RepID=A0ABQ4JDS0_9ACTN|nr:hypothetical protein [Micromonospora qiuiae]GIJ28279.1 hypothetical protein Vqi01_34410 [Micromonospora qiuiae]